VRPLLVDGKRYERTASDKAVPGTGASAVPDRRKYQSHDDTEAGKALRLTVPEDLAVTNYAGSTPSRDARLAYRSTTS
jgi:hypothetical protein